VIAKDKVVTFDYRLTDDKGTLIDSSDEGGPLTYLHGHGNLIPGLESHLEGMASGTEFKVHVEPDQGYGLRDESLVAQVPKEQFAEAGEVEAGMAFGAMTDDGPVTVVVTKVEGDVVHVDANHPLAGVALNFEGTIREVREPTEEEISQGHVQGPSEENQ
jgi:FKBP-type peptidyl-prolyl cis-trans isomerase SlyD